MTEHPVSRGRAFVSRVHLFMGVLALVLAAGVAVFAGFREAFAALVGGFAVVLPQVFVARRLLQAVRAQHAQLFMIRLWVWQSVKWAATALLMAAALVQFKTEAAFVLSGFIVTFQGLWIAPLVLNRTGQS